MKEEMKKAEERNRKRRKNLSAEKEALEKRCAQYEATIKEKGVAEQSLQSKLVHWKSNVDGLKEKLRKREASEGNWMAILAQHQQHEEQLTEELAQYKKRCGCCCWFVSFGVITLSYTSQQQTGQKRLNKIC